LTVDGAVTLDAKVCRVHGDDQRVAHWVAAAVDERVEVAIVGGVGAAEQSGLSVEVQDDVAFDLDRAGEKAAGGKMNGPAAGCGAIIDGILDSERVERRAVAYRSRLGDVDRPVRRRDCWQRCEEKQNGREQC